MSKVTWKPGTFLYPLPAVMVSCGDMEKSNIITVAWTGIINTDPAMVYISVRPSRYSYNLIKEKGEFIINLTTKDLAYATDWCGVKTGAKIDKFKEMKLTKEKAKVSRQSVSKWENGEAYPEMNNILELCKIFNLKTNDLVHNDISDISSLDEEIVMSVVKFNEEKQKQVKSVCNVIEMIGKIGGIVLKVAIPFLVLAIILVPYIVSNVNVIDNELTFKTDNIKLATNGDLEIYGIVMVGLDADTSIEDVIEMFNNNSKYKIIGYFETGLILLIVDLIIMIIIFSYVEKLFSNIKNNKTPFTIDNVNYIKKISYLMIALIIITPISGNLFNSLLNLSSEESGFELMGIMEILIIFSMSYIFEYGVLIQKDSKGKMYN